MNLREIYNNTLESLKSAGIENASGEAEMLLCNAYGCDRLHLLFFMDKETAGGSRYEESGSITMTLPESILDINLKRRLEGEPIQYILGTAPFLDMELFVNSSVLIPRPETEELADLAQKEIKKRRACGKTVKCLDLCTGSGCIAIAMDNVGGNVTATDISPEALRVAKRNAKHQESNIEFFEGDLFAALPGSEQFDVITANPPYIPSSVCTGLQREVREHEPMLALDGGADGLDIITRILAELNKYLAPGGILLMEIGDNQAEAVLKLCHGGEIIKDMQGKDRIFLFNVSPGDSF